MRRIDIREEAAAARVCAVRWIEPEMRAMPRATDDPDFWLSILAYHARRNGGALGGGLRRPRNDVGLGRVDGSNGYRHGGDSVDLERARPS